MSAFFTACRLYHSVGYSTQDAIDDMAWHARHGYVIATPCEYALARPVALQWSEEKICSIEENNLSEFELTWPLNCWHVSVAVGELGKLLDYLPYQLPYISYERREKFKIRKSSIFYEKSTTPTCPTRSDPSG